jgi:hypothetical protein
MIITIMIEVFFEKIVDGWSAAGGLFDFILIDNKGKRHNSVLIIIKLFANLITK